VRVLRVLVCVSFEFLSFEFLSWHQFITMLKFGRLAVGRTFGACPSPITTASRPSAGATWPATPGTGRA
jgi:hypothetical protein